MTFNERHKESLTFNEYQKAVDGPGRLARTMTYDVFLSYADENTDLAEEFVRELQRRELTCFMAKRSIESGGKWIDEIRDALLGSREMAMLLTPEAIDSSWVMLEAGAAWALEKRLTPCIVHVRRDDIPEPILSHQTRNMQTQADKEEIAREISLRLRTSNS